jgi:hypothetical protein
VRIKEKVQEENFHPKLDEVKKRNFLSPLTEGKAKK